MVEMKQRSMAEDSQKTLEALKERYANKEFACQHPNCTTEVVHDVKGYFICDESYYIF